MNGCEQVRDHSLFLSTIFRLSFTSLAPPIESRTHYGPEQKKTQQKAILSLSPRIAIQLHYYYYYYYINHSPSHEQWSEWVSEWANEWVQRNAQAKPALWSKRTSERCERMSKRTSEWPSTYVPILDCSAPLWSVRQSEPDWRLSRPIRLNSFGYLVTFLNLSQIRHP